MVRIFPTQITRFPSVSEADESGLVAIGGSYDFTTLYNAYISGIFPWFDEKIVFGSKCYNYIYWYSPNPRFVLFKEDFRIGKRLKRYFRKSKYRYSSNENFEAVIRSCQIFHRLKESTWISDEMVEGYLELNRKGYIKSVEVWDDNKLVGGLYGVNINRYFCGESMFGLDENVSKFAFIYLATNLFNNGYDFIDCQVYSTNLSRFGAVNIPREDFMFFLKKALKIN